MASGRILAEKSLPEDFSFESSTGTSLGSADVTNGAPAPFPLGTTTVTWSATDASGNVGSDTQDVTVLDTTPPTLSVSLSPTSLWPPSHKLKQVDATIGASYVCNPSPLVTHVSIMSKEPDNGIRDGHTTGDIQGADLGTDDRSFELRAERQGGSTESRHSAAPERAALQNPYSWVRFTTRRLQGALNPIVSSAGVAGALRTRRRNALFSAGLSGPGELSWRSAWSRA